eukprot:TRINITY_DN91654_c0_g1_i1.p1 TRINITY_DN91654_c0_g1~~TRINITY_DN91654_c0_g1_i1.p1  ORF type:complete len:171 (+),score=21.28 TRINITY_DN91654_c0_g1_i1:53-565(+)
MAAVSASGCARHRLARNAALLSLAVLLSRVAVFQRTANFCSNTRLSSPRTRTARSFHRSALPDTEETADDALEQMVSDGVPFVIDFTSAWCGPCRLMRKVMEDVEKQFTGHVPVLKVDVNTNKDLAGNFGIRGVPTVMLFNGGSSTPVKTFVGVASREAVTRAIKRKLLS